MFSDSFIGSALRLDYSSPVELNHIGARKNLYLPMYRKECRQWLGLFLDSKLPVAMFCIQLGKQLRSRCVTLFMSSWGRRRRIYWCINMIVQFRCVHTYMNIIIGFWYYDHWLAPFCGIITDGLYYSFEFLFYFFFYGAARNFLADVSSQVDPSFFLGFSYWQTR